MSYFSKQQIKNDIKNIQRTWVSQTQLQLATLVAMTAAFSVAIFALGITINLKEMLSVWGQNINITVYLKDAATESDIADFDLSVRSQAMRLISSLIPT
jgi:cell division protein FtsX